MVWDFALIKAKSITASEMAGDEDTFRWRHWLRTIAMIVITRAR